LRFFDGSLPAISDVTYFTPLANSTFHLPTGKAALAATPLAGGRGSSPRDACATTMSKIGSRRIITSPLVAIS
jgi:hypothetical protein